MHYKINATDCGQCPNSTDTNSVLCGIDILTTLPETYYACAIIIQPVVCGNVSGNSSVFNVIINGNNKWEGKITM